MRIRTYTFVTLDGYVSTPDGRPIQLLLPGFPGAGAYGLPEFLMASEQPAGETALRATGG